MQRYDFCIKSANACGGGAKCGFMRLGGGFAVPEPSKETTISRERNTKMPRQRQLLRHHIICCKKEPMQRDLSVSTSLQLYTSHHHQRRRGRRAGRGLFLGDYIKSLKYQFNVIPERSVLHVFKIKFQLFLHDDIYIETLRIFGALHQLVLVSEFY